MAGKKGSKWAEEKRKEKKVPCNVAIDKDTHEKIMSFANKHEWSLNKVLGKIISEWVINNF